MKRLLLIAFLLSLAGTGAELLLLEHTQDGWQLIPVVLIGVALAATAWLTAARSTAGLWFFRGVMVLFVLSGLLGLGLHYNGNLAFELEMYPSMQGAKLVWETLKGATPVLAPGTMIATGLLGWAYTMS